LEAPTKKHDFIFLTINLFLAGGFNPSEKYSSKWESENQIGKLGENKNIFETTT